MSSSLVAEIDALISKVKACPLQAEGKAAPAQEAAPAKKEEAAPAPAKASEALDIDSVKVGMICQVGDSFDALRAAWTEAELGNIDDKDLKPYLTQVGKVMEIEEDDDTVLLRWENLDSVWIPVSQLTETTLPLSSPPPVSHLLDKSERDPLAPMEGLKAIKGPYLTDADSISEGAHVQVTEDFKLLRKEWAAAELGEIRDEDLALWLLQIGKVIEVEEDDDTVNVRWESYDTVWIPIAACRDAGKEALTSPPSVSCLAGEPTQEEEAKPVFRLKEWTLDGDQYYKEISQIKKKQRVQITTDYGYLRQAFPAKGLEEMEDYQKIAGYTGDAWELDEENGLVTVRFNNKKTIKVPFVCLYKVNKKKKKKGNPEL